LPSLTLVRASLHDITPAIPRAVEAAEGLFETVRVLCWNRGAAALPRHQVVDGIEVQRYGRRPPRRSWRTVLFVLAYALWVARRLLAQRPDVVQVCDLESAIAAVPVARLTGARVIYDMRDPFAESYRFPAGLARFAYSLDWLVMAGVSAFVIPAEERRAYLGRWARRPVCVVRNTCHDELAQVPADSEVGSRPTPRTVRIAYLGYLVDTRGADQLLDLCRRHGGEVELWVAGLCRSAALEARLTATAGVHWLGRLPRPRALALMRDVDVVSLLYDPAVRVNRIAAPNKYYEALMAATPVLMSEGMSLAGELRRHGAGWVVSYGDASALDRVVDELADSQQRQRLARAARSWFLAECRLEEELVRYRDFYRRFLGTAPEEA